MAVNIGGGASRPAPVGAPPRTAVLITGMHRNGTSALARTLSLLGAALPTDLVPANEGNPHGHWEPRGMVDLNDRMLADAGSDLYGVGDIAPDWFASPAAAAFTAEAVRLVGRSFGDEPLIVLKDPRTALLAPVWNRALAEAGYRVVHVLPLRHPADVALSLRRRHLKTIPYDAWVQPRGEAVWLRYTLAAVRGSRGHPRVFLRYSDLLADWRGEVGRVARDLGIAFPGLGTEKEGAVDAFLHGNAQAEDHHPAVDPDVRNLRGLDLAALASVCHAELCRVGDDNARVDAIHAEFSERIGGAGDLVATLENLYPLVWRFYEESTARREQLDLSLDAEARLREGQQRTWQALTQANNDRSSLQLALGSRDRQVVSLQGEVTHLERLVAEGEARFGALEDRLAAARTDLARLEHHHAAETGRMQRVLEDGEARVAAIHASTSWRVTAPLRALSRRVRGRA